MTKGFRLQPLLEIAETKSQSAAASLGAVTRQQQQQEEKLLLLVKYRTEYQDRLRRRTAAGLDGAGLRNFHDFMNRLEHAIVKQQAVVAETRRRVEAGRREWELRQRKFKAFDTLSDRFKRNAQQVESSKEQKLQDDFASRATRNKTQTHR